MSWYYLRGRLSQIYIPGGNDGIHFNLEREVAVVVAIQISLAGRAVSRRGS
jgi:hypothetical protein